MISNNSFELVMKTKLKTEKESVAFTREKEGFVRPLPPFIPLSKRPWLNLHNAEMLGHVQSSFANCILQRV
jgi:hypothetical protein